MSFNPEMLRSRLSAATEAADSITSTAHWILFHKRHATVIAEQWAEAVSTDKNKLPEIYIANEVIQQCKIKRKTELVDAFSRVLPDALAKAYIQSDLPTRDRIMRVVRVWMDRAVFSPQSQKEIEESIKSAGESLASSVPADLVILVKRFAELKSAADDPHQTIAPHLLDQVKSELARVSARVDELAAQKQDIKSPQIEPLPSTHSEESRPNVEVYTAQEAQESLENAQRGRNAEEEKKDDEDIGYATDSDDDSNAKTDAAPPEKKQKVEVDPKLASFLASITSNN